MHLLQHFPLVLTIILDNRFKLQSLIDFGGRYIYRDSHENTAYNRICSDHMDKTMKEFIVKEISICISFAACSPRPLIAYLVYGIRTTPLELHFPFTEPKSNAEFTGNFLLLVFISMHGFLVYIGLECFLSLLENAVTITPRLIESDLKQTIQLYEKKSITELELNLRIGNITKQSIDADE